MKKLVLSNIQSGVRKLGAVKATLEHVQEAYTEAIASMFTAFLAGASGPVSIHGCVNSGSGSDYNISAGSIYHNGEIFDIDAFAGTAGGGQVPVLSLVTTWRSGDPVKYSDGSTHNTHTIRKYQWSFGTSGSGLADFSAVVTLKSRINDHFLDVDGQVSAAITALVGTAPAALNTLGEISDALNDDANLYTTLTNLINAKVAKAGDTMTGALVVQSTVEAQGGIRTANSGVYLKKKVIDIGDWDMDTTGVVNIAHGLTLAKIRSVTALIRNDTDTTYLPAGTVVAGDLAFWIVSINATTVVLERLLSGFFDSTSYDSTSFNRGWIVIEYEP